MTISENLQIIGQSIRQAEHNSHRPSNSVQLLAVSKRHPGSAIRAALDTGQRAFGENYAQEMYEKALELKDPNIQWHFIGPIQSNKTRQIAEIADWVHSVERIKIARRLSDQRPQNMPPINICLQINISNEPSKSGVTPEALPELAEQVAELPGLKLRGLMAIPESTSDFARQRSVFAKVRHIQEDLIQKGFALDTLSMGMSGDMEAAIAEGATIVRIGTAIFGQRDK